MYLARLVRRFSKILVCFLVCAQPSLAQTFLAETPIAHLPSDVSVTPDGTVAIVRASEAGPPVTQPDGISAWDMSTGNRLTISGATPGGFGLGENQGFLLRAGPLGNPESVHFSDLVQTTNNRAIAIGSQRSAVGQVDDTTFVAFLKIDQPTEDTVPPTPPSISHMVNYTFTGALASDRAGHAHDVVITPNGLIAVVSHRNWVHFFQMSTGRILGSFNLGSLPLSFNGINYGPCSPDLAVDSAEVTNTRAVVIATKRDVNPTGSPLRIMTAHIFDLTTNPVTKLADVHVDNLGQSAGLDVVAHDLAISPDGSRAVVTGNNVAALLDLTTSPGLIAAHVDSNEFRDYKRHVDSVELTGTRAVVTSTRFYSFGPPPPLFQGWRIQLFDLTSFASVFQLDDSSQASLNEPHDLVITPSGPNGQKVLVRSAHEIICISNLATPAGSVTIMPAGGNPATGALNNASVISDSIIATNSVAVSIGTASGIGSTLGSVSFVDLSGTPTLSSLQTISPGQNTFTRACDLGFTPDLNRVVVRCADNVSGGPSIAGTDIYFFSCQVANLGAPLMSFSATGNVMGIDSMEIGTSSLIGISELRLPLPNWNNGDGLVQIIGF